MKHASLRQLDAIVSFRRSDRVGPILDAAALELSNEDLAEIEGRRRT